MMVIGARRKRGVHHICCEKEKHGVTEQNTQKKFELILLVPLGQL